MRIATLLLVFTGLGIGSTFAQGMDISGLKADPKTFIFNDGKRTVNGYIYSMLEQNSSCCGNDAIYLEVKYDAAGVTTSVKALTGKNDCYKKSIADIVKNVVWDAAGKATSVYFEVKPVIPCSGSPGENVYKPIGGAAPIASSEPKGLSGDENNSGNQGSTESKEVVKETPKEELVEEVVEVVKETPKEEVKEEVVEEVVEVVKETPKEVVKSSNEDDFLSDTEGSSSLPPAKAANNAGSTSSTPKAGQPKSTPATAQVPKQMDIKYTSPGDRRPEDSHNKTHWDGAPGTATNVAKPEYAGGENAIAINLKREIRNAGYCGVAVAVIEVEVDPAGNIINHRVMAANDQKVSDLVPKAMSSVKFESKPGLRRNYFAYVQFKTDIICQGMDRNSRPSLDAVPDIINTGNGAQ